MPKSAEEGRRFLLTFFAVAGLASFASLVAMVVAGMDPVKTGSADPLRSAWLVEVNGPAFAVLAAIVAIATMGGAWLLRREWREMKRRLEAADRS